MSLSRAFTTRRAQAGPELTKDHKMPHRSNTTARTTPVLRHKISAPVQLVHTTNMLSYNAPDLPRANRSNSTKSDDDSDSRMTAESTPPTSPDASPSERSSQTFPDANHLSSYFTVSAKPPEPASAPVPLAAPAIPKRSPSHSKKPSHDIIARQRSISHISRESENSVSTKASYTFSRTSSTSTRTSATSHLSAGRMSKQAAPPVPPPVSSTVPPQRAMKESHPFGQELAQVSELAEEFGSNSQLKSISEDDQYLASKGLVKHCASEYLSEIQSLSAQFFPERNMLAPSTPLWI